MQFKQNKLLFGHSKESFETHLLEIGTDEHKINATESQLRHTNKHVHEEFDKARVTPQWRWSICETQFNGFGKVWVVFHH